MGLVVNFPPSQSLGSTSASKRGLWLIKYDDNDNDDDVDDGVDDDMDDDDAVDLPVCDCLSVIVCL